MEIARCNARDLRRDDDGRWLIRAVSTNGRARDVVLPADLAEAVLDAGPGFTFKGRIDGHVSPAYVSRLISRALPGDLSSEQLRAAYKSGQLTIAPRDLAAFHSPKAVRILDMDELEQNPNVTRHLARIEQGLDDDPSMAIGSSKELLETCFKLLLRARNVPFDARKEELPNLFAKVSDTLVEAAPEEARDATRKVLRTLMNLVQSIGETRSRVGTGHGPEVDPEVQTKDARLVFNATVAVAEYTVDSWRALNR